MFFTKINVLFPVATILDGFLEQCAKCFSQFRQVDPILRPLWASDAWVHIRQVKVHIYAVIDFALARHAEHVLRAKIIFESAALLIAASRGPQIIDRFLINRKIPIVAPYSGDMFPIVARSGTGSDAAPSP